MTVDRINGIKMDPSTVGYKFPNSSLVAIGAKFSVRFAYKSKSTPRWMIVCRCECGSVGVFQMRSIRCGDTKSCGCHKIKKVRERFTTHGGYKDPEYNVWVAMIQRCTKLNDKAFHNYGGRGIKVCERWLNSYENFITDMGERPSKKHSIDRIDNDGNYCPENCRWATRKEQQRNMRSNLVLTIDGEAKCAAEWSEIYGIHRRLVCDRVKRGWDAERAVKQPIQKSRKKNHG